MSTYADANDVLLYAGVTVDASVVARSEAIIELYTNRTSDAIASYTARDKYWLKLATSYQAAYMHTHPELFSLMDAESYSQGDIAIKFRGHADGAVISPLTKKALGQVSWNRTRSIHVKSDFITNSDIINADDEDTVSTSGASFGWTPFGTSSFGG